MGSQSVLAGPVAGSAHMIQRQNDATAAVVRILQAQQPGADSVFVVRSDHARKLFRGDRGTVPLNRPRNHLAQLCEPALFVVIDMATRLA